MLNRYSLFLTILFFVATVVFVIFYGASQRKYVAPTVVLSVDTPERIEQELLRKGVRGRAVICFTRYLNIQEKKESKSIKVVENAMNHGIIRKVYHVPPDRVWLEIRQVLEKWGNMKPFSGGFVGVFDDGRVYITPLSKMPDIKEKTVVIIEPEIWTSDEMSQIVGRFKAGELDADLLFVVRGSDKVAEQFRNALVSTKLSY